MVTGYFFHDSKRTISRDFGDVVRLETLTAYADKLGCHTFNTYDDGILEGWAKFADGWNYCG